MNTERQRDTGMDRLLRAALAEDASVPGGACPDADTVAAYADGGLTARERTDIEPHLASCAHCQTVIAMMAREAEIDARTSPTSAPRPSNWRAWFTIPRLQWLVPAGAAALALVLYVAVKPGPATMPGQEAAAPTAAPAPEFTMAQRSSDAPAQTDEAKSLARPAPPAPAARRSPGAFGGSQPSADERSVRPSTTGEAAPAPGRSTIGAPPPPLAQGLALPVAESVSAAPAAAERDKATPVSPSAARPLPAAPSIAAAQADVVVAVSAAAPPQAPPSAVLAAGNAALPDAAKGRPQAEGAVAERGAAMSRAPERQRDVRVAELPLVAAQQQAKREVLVEVGPVRTVNDVDNLWARADMVVTARGGNTRPPFLSRERTIKANPDAAAPIVAADFTVVEVFKRADSIPPTDRFVMWQVGSEAVAIKAGDEYVLFLNRGNLGALPGAVTPSAGPSSVLRLDSLRPDVLARLRQLAGTARR